MRAESDLSDQFIIGPSLPPFVEGQLRCFLHLRLGEIKWLGSKPKHVKVAVKWWGQQSSPIFLHPRSPTGLDSVKHRNEVKYPIRSGPKQFTAYLKDMNTLVLDVVASKEKIGQVDIHEIGLLCQSQPIQGFFPILCSELKSGVKEIGAMFVSLEFQSISGSFHITSSTIPTTDMPASKQAKKQSAKKQPKAMVKRMPVQSSEEIKKKPRKEVKISASPPERIEYSMVSPESIQTTESSESVIEVKQKSSTQLPEVDEIRSKEHAKPAEVYSSPRNLAKNHVLAKPSPAQEKISQSEATEPNEGDSIDKGNIKEPLSGFGSNSSDDSNSKRRYSGRLFKDILDQVDEGDSLEGILDASLSPKSEDVFTDRALVDLVTGEDSSVRNILKRIDSDESLLNELSDHDHDDPIYDDSLLADLFYTNKDSSDLSSVVSSNESTVIEETKEQDFENLESKLAPVSKGSKRSKQTKPAQSRNSDGSASKEKNLEKEGETGENDYSLQYLDMNSEDIGSEGKEAFLAHVNKFIPEGMNLDTITELVRVHFARVVIHSLQISDEFLKRNPKSTFFIEYEFPVCTKDAKGKRSFCTELMRCVSNKFSERGVVFNHRSIFPVYFDTDTLVRWWDKQLLFKIFCRKTQSQSPVLFGKVKTPLRQLLLADDFIVQQTIPVMSKDTGDDENAQKTDLEIGQLQVTIDLGSDKADMKRKNGKALTHAISDLRNETQDKKIKVIDYTSKPKTLSIQTTNQDFIQTDSNAGLLHNREDIPVVAVADNKHDEFAVELHSLLRIPDGRGIATEHTKGLLASSNAYLVCRLLWHDKAPKSDVCWNSVDPKFDFCETIPVLLNDILLQRIKDNFVVIEIWHKSLMAESDKLIGIVKISLQPIFISFKEKSLRKTLLGSQYPVVAVDDWVSVQDLFDGTSHGEIRVLLAFGSQSQVRNLLKMKRHQPAKIRGHGVGRDEPMRDSYQISQQQHSTSLVQHIFGISIESAKNMIVIPNSKTGEKDCFVQYQFPVQARHKNVASLAWHKTPTTLCLANSTFGHSNKHSFTLQTSVPVQNFILNAVDSEKGSSMPSLAFEIWQRSYYPNIRDCLMYKAVIQVAKLCAMVAMHQRNEPSFQSFQLPLQPVNKLLDDTSNGAFLSVNISYQKTFVADNLEPKFTETRNPSVCISVSILRACGLKACLENPKKNHRNKLKDFPSTGLNTFVRVFPSFLGRGSTRTSQVIARSFAPAFSYHIDFPVSVLDEIVAAEDCDEASSLAFQLESEHLIIEIYHQPSRSSFLPLRSDAMHDEEDVIIGVAKIPLIGLLFRQTGIKGWFSVLRVDTQRKSLSNELSELNNNTGGLEIAVKFANPTDRELVINTARGIGWCPIMSLEMHDEGDIETGTNHRYLSAAVVVEKLWLSRDVFENATRQEKQTWKDYRVYCRYKFYDNAALSSRMARFEKDTTGSISANVNHRKEVNVTVNAALFWYLREEMFEVHFWLKTQGNEDVYATQRSRDRLLGSAHIDLSAAIKGCSCEGVVSGLYPLFRFGADYLGNSHARISLRFRDPTKSSPSVSLDDKDSLTDYPFDQPVAAYPGASSESDQSIPDDSSDVHKVFVGEDAPVDLQSREELTGVEFRIVIEKALHLPMIDDDASNKSRNSPSTFASYQLTPLRSPVVTTIARNTTKPSWHFDKKEVFDPLKIANQKINFKVFRKSSEEDKIPDVTKDVLIGTAVVDISPLNSGLQQINGWYNITDFTGQCTGQIKVGVIPEKPLITSPSSRYFRNQQLTEKIYSQFPATRVDTIPFCLDEDIEDNNFLRPTAMFNREERADTLVLPNADTSKSMLLLKLRGQMGELDSLTNSLRNKLFTSSKAVPSVGDDECNLNVTGNSFNTDGVRDLEFKRMNHVAEFGDVALPGTIATNEEANDAYPSSSVLFPTEINTHGTDMHSHAPLVSASRTENAFDADNAREAGSFVDDSNDANSIDSSRCEREYDSFDDVLSDWSKFKGNERMSGFEEDKKMNDSHDDDDDDDHMDFSMNKFKDDGSFEEGILSQEKTLENMEEHGQTRRNEDSSHVNSLQLVEPTSDPGQIQTYISRVDNILKSRRFSTEADDSDSPDKPEQFQPDYGIGNDDRMRQLPSGANTFETNIQGPLQKGSELEAVERYSKTARSAEGGMIKSSRVEKNEDSDRVLDGMDRMLDGNDRMLDGNDRHASQASHAQAETIPNFFMPADKLIESMRKLRLQAAIPRLTTEQQHDRDCAGAATSPSLETVAFATAETEKRYNRRKNFYSTKESKPNVDKPPPLQTSELSRIASIFSSRFTQ